jgi:hypothetical protein
MSPPADPLLELTTIALETRHGTRRALIAAPRQPVILGRERLAALRADDFSSPINERLLAAIDTAEEPIHVVIFKAGGTGGWHFDDGLDADTCAELGYHLLRSQLRLYRDAATRGVFNVIGVEFGARELEGYARGTDRLAAELEHQIADANDSAVARFDLWLIDHVGLWSGASLEEFLRDSAADATATAERHQRQIARLMAEIDAAD